MRGEGDRVAKRKQHYVPQVYLKAWETQVETLKDPDNKFKGVYTFECSSGIGDGANKASILWMSQLYTIRFEHRYICTSCPRVLNYFVERIYNLMRVETDKPVYAKFGYSIIKTKASIRKHFFDIDDWQFYYDNGNLGKQKAIMNKICALNCYILETEFDDFFEKQWESVRTSFVQEVKRAIPKTLNSSERIISMSVANKMLSFFFVMLCRSPYFTAMGFYERIKRNLLYPSFESMFLNATGDETRGIVTEDTKHIISDAHSYVDGIFEGIWMSELYRILFGGSGGFYYNILDHVRDGCQLILFETEQGADHFITSDNPAFENRLMITTENWNGFIFPLTPEYLVLIGKGGDALNMVDYRIARAETVKKLNQIIANNKKNTVIADRKHLRLDL